MAVAFKKVLNFSYNQLILYGVHMGHSFLNSILYTSWLIYSYASDILIINIYKTIYMLRSGFTLLRGVCYLRAPIWFINLDQAAHLSVNYSSKLCGEFGWTKKWLNGLISNYIGIFGTYMRLSTQSTLSFRKNQFWIKDIENFFLTRFSWPRLIFVSSVSSNYSAVKEALALGIICLGITDTDAYSNIITFPIPGNDDSVDCLFFYNELIASFILLQKITSIVTWYFSIRYAKRLNKFRSWLVKKLFNKNSLLFSNKRSTIFSNLKKFWNLKISNKSLVWSTKLLFFGTDLFSNKSINSNIFRVSDDINSNRTNRDMLLFMDFLKNLDNFRFIITIEWVRRLFSSFRILSREDLSDSNFRKYFLNRNSSYFSAFFCTTKSFFYNYKLQGRFMLSKFFYPYLKYFYLNKYLNIRVQSGDINLGVLSSYYIKVLSNYFYSSSTLKRYSFSNFNFIKSGYRDLFLVKKLKNIFRNIAYFPFSRKNSYGLRPNKKFNFFPPKGKHKNFIYPAWDVKLGINNVSLKYNKYHYNNRRTGTYLNTFIDYLDGFGVSLSSCSTKFNFYFKSCLVLCWSFFILHLKKLSGINLKLILKNSFQYFIFIFNFVLFKQFPWFHSNYRNYNYSSVLRIFFPIFFSLYLNRFLTSKSINIFIRIFSKPHFKSIIIPIARKLWVLCFNNSNRKKN